MFSIVGVHLKQYVSPKFLDYPDLYTKKGLPRKQDNRLLLLETPLDNLDTVGFRKSPLTY